MSAATSLRPRLDLGSGYPDKYFFGRSDYDYFFDAPQPDPTVLPLSNWNPVTNTAPVMVNGQIWMVVTNTVDTGTGRGSIHWLRIDAANTAIIEEGYIGDATQYFVFPTSIAANHDGDVVIGFNAVGPGPGQFCKQLRGGRQDCRQENGIRNPDAARAWDARKLSAPPPMWISLAGATSAARRSTPRTIRRSGPSSRSPSIGPTGPRQITALHVEHRELLAAGNPVRWRKTAKHAAQLKDRNCNT